MQVIAPVTDNSFASTFAKLVREDRSSEALEPKKNQVHVSIDPSFALMKLEQVLAHVQVSRSNWLEGVRTGRYPAPVRLSTRRVAWRVADIKFFIDSL